LIAVGETREAARLLGESLDVFCELGEHVLDSAIALLGFAELAARLGEARTGAPLFGAAEALSDRMDAPLRAERGRAIERLEAALGGRLLRSDLDQARREGATLADGGLEAIRKQIDLDVLGRTAEAASAGGF
jgi:hypothetical protein